MKKMIIVGVLLLASAAFATAQVAQSPDRPHYTFFGSQINTTLQSDSTEQLADGTLTLRNVTITIGDFVITADAATLDRTGFRLGANARVNLPTREAFEVVR